MTGFLGSEDTFLGVILTLNVLCLFSSKNNNFIFGLLSEQWERLKQKLTNLQESISPDENNVKSDKRYEAIQKVITKRTNCSEDLYQSALQIQFRLDNALQNLKTDLSLNIISERIEKSNEQLRAPFFTFLFGIAIFSINMITGWCDTEDTRLLLPGVWIFTLLSIIYWCAIWITFYYRNLEKKEASPKGNNFWQKIDKKFKWHKGGCIKIALCTAIATIVLSACTLSTLPSFVAFAIVIAILLMPICIIGICRLISCGVKGNYSSIHTLGHVAAFFVYSIALTAIYNIFGERVCDGLFQNYNALTGCIVFFALLNGIICPFILPYYKYRIFYNKCSSDLLGKKANLSNAIHTFEEEFKNWCSQKVISDSKENEPRKNS